MIGPQMANAKISAPTQGVTVDGGGVSSVVPSLMLGYNFIIAPRLLVGVEGEIAPNIATSDVEIEWTGAARLRGGLLVTPNVLAYGTVGWGTSGIDDLTRPELFAPIPIERVHALSVGSGVEAAITDRWRLRADYQRYFTDTINVVLPAGAAAASSSPSKRARTPPASARATSSAVPDPVRPRSAARLSSARRRRRGRSRALVAVHGLSLGVAKHHGFHHTTQGVFGERHVGSEEACESSENHRLGDQALVAAVGRHLLAILHAARECVSEQPLHVAGGVGGRLVGRWRMREQRPRMRGEAGIVVRIASLPAAALFFFQIATHIVVSPSSFRGARSANPESMRTNYETGTA